ncbi:MAG: clostripain-related cysteine peptidase [Candidatus Hermodarchaeota archaeon]|nr:clostripain-related cysteine peptidase [Candidatus Hermodarchaeota archaeon]
MKGARSVLLLLFSLLLVTFALNMPFPLANPQNSLSKLNFTENYPQFIEGFKVSKTPMQGSSPREWTLLVYMAADNGSESAAFDDIKEMEELGGTSQINILVYVDFESNSTGVNLGATTYNITRDPPPVSGAIFSSPLATPLETDPNMGDPETLLNFTLYGQSFAPANHYLLILWGLGAGYEGVCYDEGSDDWLIPGELATVLENTTLEPIDIVAFDASFMGQLEVLYELGTASDLFLASENLVPKEHFPYHVFLNSLLLFPDL